MSSPDTPAGPRPQLSLFDTVSIIVGIIIGSGLYKTTPIVAGSVASVGQLAGVWIAGGLFALLGSLCYAELATADPADGGDFVYLTRALGRPVGFLFGWMQLWVIRPGSTGAMAFVFAHYAAELMPLGPWGPPVYACAAIALLAAVNVLGVRQGKWTQNVLTTAKVLGLLAVAAAGLFATPHAPSLTESAPTEPNVRLALILVLFTYSGWNEMAYVAAEVRSPERNVLRALLLGTLAVVFIYLSVNAAFVRVLGLSGLAGSQAVAADMMQRAAGPWGAKAVSVLICVSALGAMNGMTFTGARIYYAMGQQHALFSPLGVWSARFGTPARSILLEAGITVAMVVALSIFYASAADPFTHMVDMTAWPFWLFLSLTGLTVIVLRGREPCPPGAFRLPLHPWGPIAFCLVCLFMLYSSVHYAWTIRGWEGLWGLGMLIVGAALACRERSSRAPKESV